jgi:Ca2+:H+ antiporter
MLREGHFRLIMSSLLGSILVNVLLILGLAIWAGGRANPGQKWNVQETRTLVLGTAFGAASILVPVCCFRYLGWQGH